eukprot:4127470-Prymnesium_polylepis.1
MEAMGAARGLQGLQRVEAATLDDAEVVELSDDFPGKEKGYHANACSHVRAWRQVAALDGAQGGAACGDEQTGGEDAAAPVRSGAWALILEDDVCLHTEWRALLSAAAAAIENEGDGAAADCLLLDGLFITGEASAEHGWLGPPSDGPHRAEGVAFSSAYALTADAARWLLEVQAARPGSSTESYLMMLQEERGRCWTHLPRLALQRWDEDASSVCGKRTGSSMRSWYEANYFPRFPWSLYAV